MSLAVVLPRPYSLLRSLSIDVSPRNTLELMRVSGQPSFFMYSFVGGDAEFIEHEIRGRVVGVHDHQVNCVSQRNLRAGRKVRGQDCPIPALDRLFLSSIMSSSDNLPLFDRVVRGDHHRQLDEARRRHRAIGFVFVGLARLEILDRQADFALMRLDQGQQCFFQRLLRLAGFGAQ